MANKRKRGHVGVLDNAKRTHVDSEVQSDRCIIMAVDFGTTFSGLAWAQSRQPEVQQRSPNGPRIRPKSLAVDLVTVPTELAYSAGSYQWGLQIGQSEARHQLFKLGLSSLKPRSTKLWERYRNPLAAVSSGHHTPQKLCTDFLTALKQHGDQILKTKLPASALKSTRMRYILTIPAIWDPPAQSVMRKCAEAAGVGNADILELVSEPEAAAIYAPHELGSHDLKEGDTFVICDAGGGTVDLIAYRIEALQPKLKIVEVCPGDGAMCGGSVLDLRFQEYLTEKVQYNSGWNIEIMEEAKTFFEEMIKPQFSGVLTEKYIVPGLPPAEILFVGLDDDPENSIKRGKMTFTGTDIRQIFEPVLDEITKLVLNQIQGCQSSVKAVLLVGGFGGSAYLRNEIAKAVNMESDAIEVLQTREGYWSPYYGNDRINIMSWFNKKGDIVQENSRVRLEYMKHFIKSGGHFARTFSLAIYVCNNTLSAAPPRYMDDVGCEHLVDLKADLSLLPWHDFKTEIGHDGHHYYVVKYFIEITHYSAWTTYELIYKGKKYGKVTVDYA